MKPLRGKRLREMIANSKAQEERLKKEIVTCDGCGKNMRRWDVHQIGVLFLCKPCIRKPESEQRGEEGHAE